MRRCRKETTCESASECSKTQGHRKPNITQYRTFDPNSDIVAEQSWWKGQGGGQAGVSEGAHCPVVWGLRRRR